MRRSRPVPDADPTLAWSAHAHAGTWRKVSTQAWHLFSILVLTACERADGHGAIVPEVLRRLPLHTRSALVSLLEELTCAGMIVEVEIDDLPHPDVFRICFPRNGGGHR